MASPFIRYPDLIALATNGGYNLRPALSELSAVFLLSSCLVMQQKWLWQKPIDPITDTEYESILEMIGIAMGELMTNFGIGQIIPSVADLSVNDGILVMQGQSVLQADYPELAAVVPASWLVAATIVIPDMQEKSAHGYDGSNLGSIVGANSITLTESEMPSHTHIQNPHQHSYTDQTVLATAAGIEPALASLVTSFPSLTGSTVATNQNTGGDQPHDNVPESLAVQWFIVAR